MDKDDTQEKVMGESVCVIAKEGRGRIRENVKRVLLTYTGLEIV